MLRRMLVSILTVALIFACMVTPSATVERTLLSSQPLEISNCDSSVGWSSNGQLYLDRIVKAEGVASIGVRATIPAYSQHNFYVDYTFEAADMYEMDVLEFDLYLSDLELLDSTLMFSALLSSSGSGTSQTLTWSYSLYAQPFSVGWNHIELPFTEAAGSGFSVENVNYFALKFDRVAPQENKTYYVQIDNLRAYGYDRETWMFDDCNGNLGWTGFPEPQDAPIGKDGSYCIRYVTPLTADVPSDARRVVTQRAFNPIDVSWATHIEMDVYMSDLSVLEKSTYGLQFELTSSGTCDRNEYVWTIDEYVWTTGWNHIRMPLSAAHHNGGELDLTAANFMRFHIIRMEPVMNEWVFMVDNISFSADIIPDSPEQPDTPTQPEIPVDPDVPEIPDEPTEPEQPEGPEQPDGTDTPEDSEGTGNDQPQDTPVFDPTKPPVITPVITPVEPEEGASGETEPSKTHTKAKALAVVMVFGVIGTDVALIIRRKAKSAKEDET